ncbi:MAG: DoxX family protein [Bacteroidota bacterium]
MQTLIKTGRWFFILPFLAFGFLHFGPLEFSLPYIPQFLPFPAFWVYFTGICLIAFTISAIIGKWDKLAAVLLALMMFLFVLLIHIPGALAGDFLQTIAIFRDTAMMGAALMYAQAFAKDQSIIG